MGVCAAAHGANWQFQPYIGAAAIYTDNLLLQPDAQAEDEFVTQGRAGFALNNEDGRLTGSVNYNFEHYFYESDSDRNTSFNQFDGWLLGELMPETLFLSLKGTHFQTILDPEAPLAIDNATPLSNNRTDGTTYEINPYAIIDVGETTEARLSYAFLRADFEDNQLLGASIDDSDSQRALFSLGNPEDLRFNWMLGYESTEVDYDLSTTTDFKYEIAFLDLAAPLTGGTQLVGIYGRESDVTVDQQAGGLDSEYWEAGLRYRGGVNNRFEARVGERYFGDSYFYQWTYDGPVIALNSHYQQKPTTLGLAQNLRPFIVADPESGEPVVRASTFTAEVYLDKTFNTQLTWKGSRSSVTLSFTDTAQEFDSAPDDEEQRSVGVQWQRRLGPRTDLAARGLYAEHGYRGQFVDSDGDGIAETPVPNAAEDEWMLASLTLRRQIGQRLSAELSYRYVDRGSNLPATDAVRGYSENRVMLAFTWGMRGLDSR